MRCVEVYKLYLKVGEKHLIVPHTRGVIQCGSGWTAPNYIKSKKSNKKLSHRTESKINKNQIVPNYLIRFDSVRFIRFSSFSLFGLLLLRAFRFKPDHFLQTTSLRDRRRRSIFRARVPPSDLDQTFRKGSSQNEY